MFLLNPKMHVAIAQNTSHFLINFKLKNELNFTSFMPKYLMPYHRLSFCETLEFNAMKVRNKLLIANESKFITEHMQLCLSRDNEI